MSDPRPSWTGNGGGSNVTGATFPGARIPVGLEPPQIVGKLVKRMAETNLGYVDLSFMLRNQAGFANRAVLVKREVYINFAESEVA